MRRWGWDNLRALAKIVVSIGTGPSATEVSKHHEAVKATGNQDVLAQRFALVPFYASL